MYKLWEDFLAELPMIKAAPRSFGVVILIIAAVIWFLVNQIYSIQLSGKDTQIGILHDTIAEYQGKLNGATPTEAADKIAQLQKEIEALRNPPRDPDGLYQLGQEVGSVGPGDISIGNGTIIFHGVRSAGKLNANQNVEYRDFILRCGGLPATPSMDIFSGTISSVSALAECSIVGKRSS